MANEVIIEEYGPQIYKTDGNLSGAAMPKLITSQTKDIGVLSNVLNPATAYVVVQSKGTGFWVATGTNAAANTPGSIWVPADGSREFPVDGSFTQIDTAA